MAALVRWSMFCLATGRTPRLHVESEPWFAVADREDLTYAEKLSAYRKIADDYLDTERYQDFCAARLGHVDEVVLEWVTGPDFDDLLLQTVRETYPEHEHERFLAHFRGLVGLWASDERTRLTSVAVATEQ
jgi:hypothetical protein